MPLLDVTEVLADAYLADVFTVQRRVETIGTNGRSTLAQQTFNNVVGVITMASPTELDRLASQPDFQVASRTISVVTRFPLRMAVKGEQPDVVVWLGTTYLVAACDGYPQFGAGFYQALCTSMDRADVPMDSASAMIPYL